MERSREEIQAEIDNTEEAIASGQSAYPAMSYEEGVNNALRWATGEITDPPMEA